MPAKFELIAPCFFGCESTANFELRRIGAEDIRVSDGRLTFRGGADMIAAANLNLRTVERVMLLLNTYTATTFDELFDGVYSIHWEELLPADAAFPVTGSSLNSQLSSVPACQSIIKKAVVKRLMQGHRTTSLPETGAEYKIRFMLRRSCWTPPATACTSAATAATLWRPPSVRHWPLPSPIWAASAATASWKTPSAAAAPSSSRPLRRP